MGRHVDGHRRLSVLLTGAVSERGSYREEHAATGSVGLKGAHFEHETRFGAEDGATVLSVLLTDPVLGHLGVQAALTPGRWRHSEDATLAGMRLAIALERADAPGAGQAMRALLPGFAAGACPRRAVPARMLRVLARLDEPHPPSVRELADHEGVHPVVLGRQFRQTFGCSITVHRQRRRVAHVARALAGGSNALVNIALDHGFSDLSHMSRVFRRELDLPPGEFRAALQAGHARLDSFKTEWRVRI